jgi:hypothetical protein
MPHDDAIMTSFERICLVQSLMGYCRRQATLWVMNLHWPCPSTIHPPIQAAAVATATTTPALQVWRDEMRV